MINRDAQVTGLERDSYTIEAEDAVDISQESETTVIPSSAHSKKQAAVSANGVHAVEISPRDQQSTSASVSLARPNHLTVTQEPEGLSEWNSGPMMRLQSELLHTCLPFFFAEHDPVRSLGFTSAVVGEGKTLLAWLLSYALAANSPRPVLLVECDWEHPTFCTDLNLSSSAGLADYLTGMSERSDIRYQVLPNLTIIPAGVGDGSPMSSLASLQELSLYDQVAEPSELMIVDLPSILGSHYGALAARVAESLLLVVRSGVTPTSLVTRACEELKQLRVEGIILNQVRSRVPRWLQSML